MITGKAFHHRQNDVAIFRESQGDSGFKKPLPLLWITSKEFLPLVIEFSLGCRVVDGFAVSLQELDCQLSYQVTLWIRSVLARVLGFEGWLGGCCLER